MSATINTATAAHQAHVSTSTIRRWCRDEIIDAARIDRRWAIDADSLQAYVVGKLLAAFRNADSAEAKALELIDQEALIAGPRDGIYFAKSSDGSDTYFVDTIERSCTCQGHANLGHCYHRVAAAMVETRTAELVAA